MPEGTRIAARLRDGLEAVGLDPKRLLVHGMSESVYVAPLIENPADYLFGVDSEPANLFDSTLEEAGSEAISEWWRRKWVFPASHAWRLAPRSSNTIMFTRFVTVAGSSSLTLTNPASSATDIAAQTAFSAFARRRWGAMSNAIAA